MKQSLSKPAQQKEKIHKINTMNPHMPSTIEDQSKEEIFSDEFATKCQTERRARTCKLSAIQVPQFVQPQPISLIERKSSPLRKNPNQICTNAMV